MAKRVKMTLKRKQEKQRKEGVTYIKPPDKQAKVPYTYSAAFQRWFERVRVS